MSDRILITGGAGFVGSSLAVAFKKDRPDSEIIALDNLKRRGSELNLPRLAEAGVAFQLGDIRNPEDLEQAGPVALLIECSAEASVHAGYDGQDPAYLVNTNLVGAFNALEFLRKNGGDLVFLSSSRVYPITTLRELPLEVSGDRFSLKPGAAGLGWSENGISEEFPIDGTRSLYGATKLCAEMLIREYSEMYGLRAVINRCGVISGPWQMGQVDQGFVTLWMARHLFGGSLAYRGFNGDGHQVRDVLHVADLYDLLCHQISDMDRFTSRVFNAGGGAGVSTSLRELTAQCQTITGNEIEMVSYPETRAADIPFYISDNSKIAKTIGWSPIHSLEEILEDIHSWLLDYQEILEPVFSET
jgi:CDP-paratose 2-epimerase